MEGAYETYQTNEIMPDKIIKKCREIRKLRHNIVNLIEYRFNKHYFKNRRDFSIYSKKSINMYHKIHEHENKIKWQGDQILEIF